jgi:hypothetical protein
MSGVKGIRWSPKALAAMKRSRVRIHRRFMEGESMRMLAKSIGVPLFVIEEAIRKGKQ